MNAPSLPGAALLVCALFAAPAQASEGADVAQLINAYRASPAQCEGHASPPLAPLASNPALASVRLAPGRFLQPELTRAGVRAAHAEAIGVSGTNEAGAVLQLLRQRYCRSLRDARFTDIGVADTGNGLSIILAQTFVLAPLPSPAGAGQALLDAVNQVRAHPRNCGTGHFAAAAPLTWSAALAQAALAHSEDMAIHHYFSHQGKDGRQVGERAQAAGYRWQRIGENIASGMRSPAEAMEGWLASPGHCANLMNAGFTEMGAGYGQGPALPGGGDGIVFWTQVFGRPR